MLTMKVTGQQQRLTPGAVPLFSPTFFYLPISETRGTLLGGPGAEGKQQQTLYLPELFFSLVLRHK